MKQKLFEKLSIVVVLIFAIPSYAHARGGVEDYVVPAIVGLLGSLIVFLIFREFFCWYGKINQVVALLTEISNTLKNKPKS